MIKLLPRPALRPALLAAAGLMTLSAAQARQALTIRPAAPAGEDLPDVDPGALLFHGNYCGPGSRGPGYRPVDALDTACARHDACTPEGDLPTCACNARLQFEANIISQSPRQPADIRGLSGMVAAGAALLPCR